ncbi:RNA 2'-phosphotransferase, Tpt1 [Syncephalis fuscata]|nr:RNA 2'-phosphotransferase, Tpt1 [Syncephalis fuscata]
MSTPSGSRPRGKRNTRDSPEVRLSKALSYVLRHGAIKEGISIRPDGFVAISEILSLPKFRSYTITDIRNVVVNNSKQRFTLCQEEDAIDNIAIWWIRANQGHSLATTIVHGTYYRFWPSIGNSEGLRRMARNHIHLAIGLPGKNDVISGMRTTSQLYIYIDAAKAMAEGIQFLRSSNQVILTTGEGDTGTIPIRYFSRVEDKEGNVLMQDGQLLVELNEKLSD